MKTTKKQFELFKEECERWIAFWGLLDWNVGYFHEEIRETSWAQTNTNLDGKICTIRLNTRPNQLLTEEILKRVAFHEVCEVLIGSLVVVAGARYINAEEITEAGHDIIRRLENCVYKRIENG